MFYRVAGQRNENVAVDPELVMTLVSAVKRSMEDGLPLEGTRLGHVLGDAYRQRQLPTGPGAYKPVIETAVREGHLKKVWSQDRKGMMALILPELEVPQGWEDQARESPPVGLPSDTLYLRRELYQAFSGIRGPCSLDITDPPIVRVVEGVTTQPLVTPLATEEVVRAWKKFADEHLLDAQAKVLVASTLGNSFATAWGRIEIPGDNPQLRLGIQFHRARSRLLVEHVRAWFAEQGKDPNDFELASPPRTQPERPPAAPLSNSAESRSASKEGETRKDAKALRERLKGIIDRMSVQQLHQLWIPTEFLDL